MARKAAIGVPLRIKDDLSKNDGRTLKQFLQNLKERVDSLDNDVSVIVNTNTQTTTTTSTTTVGAGVTTVAEDTSLSTPQDFSGIPSTAKIIHVTFDAVSISGTDNVIVQLGDAGGVETTGYVSRSGTIPNGASPAVTTSNTSGFVIRSNSGANVLSGVMTLIHVGGNKWIGTHNINMENTQSVISGAGTKTLSATLTTLRITPDGANTFDAGAIGVTYVE